MSALVILECNVCGAITPPWPTADRAREEAGPEGWAVDVDGSNIDYCPKCTAPAAATIVATPSGMPFLGPVALPRSRIEAARRGVAQLRDVLSTIANTARTMDPAALGSVAALAVRRADELLAELAA